MKQLRILHGQGFDLEERKEAIMVIINNLELAIARILREMQATGIFGHLDVVLMKVCKVLWYLITRVNGLYSEMSRYDTLL